MRYDLIWKAIDQELVLEERNIVNELMNESPVFKEEMDSATGMNELLTNHFSHTMDMSFLAKLKQRVIEELDIPRLKINFVPILIFITVSVLSYIISVNLPHQGFMQVDWTTYGPLVKTSAVVMAGISLLTLVDVALSKKVRKNRI